MSITGEQAEAGRAVVYDEEHGRLVMGDRSRTIPAQADNRTVLERYVDLVGESRGRPMSDALHLRSEDVDALSRSLDLDAARLVEEIEALLGATPAEAEGLLARLRKHRLTIGIAVVSAMGVAGGGVLAASVIGTDSSPSPAPPASVAASAPASAESSADLGALVEPMVDGDVFDLFAVDLAPAVSVVAPEPAEVDGLGVEDDVELIPPVSITND